MTAPRILLVDPSDGSRRLRDAFETAGWSVQQVATATAAVGVLSTDDCDCLVSAFELPGDDGLALRSAVRRLRPELPFVLFTDSDNVERSVAVGSDRDSYVPRNGAESVDRLLAEVRMLAEQSTDEPIAAAEPMDDTLLSTVEAAPIGISLCDPSLPDEPLVYVNDTWQELTDYGIDDVLGRNPRLLQGPDTDPETVDRLSAAIANEEPISVEIRNYRQDGTPFWNELTVAPIYDDGELRSYVGFQIDVTDRREAEARAQARAETLAEERRTLRRVLDRINGLLREVSGVLVESTTREEIEHRICETVTDETAYAAAWIGTVSSNGTEFCVTASSGVPAELPESAPIAELPSAVQRAVDTDIPHRSLADETAAVLAPESVGGRRLLVVPLCYGDRRYGLLGVYGADDTALDSRDREVVAALGKMIANGLHAVETARLLTTDHVTELRIELRDTSFALSQIAAVADSPVDRCGTTKTAGGDCELYLSTEGSVVDPDALESLPFVRAARVVSETDGDRRVAVTMSTVPPDDILAEFGASVTELTATADGARFTVEAPPQQEVRSLLEGLESLYDSVDLRARTERNRRERPHGAFSATVADRLTERQQATLEAAHLNGYFEWPRPVDGAEVAASMDITRQTFHQHLRAAEQKLVDAYIEAC